MEIRTVSGGGYVGEAAGKGREKGEATRKATPAIVMDYVKLSKEAQEQRKLQQKPLYDKSWIAEQMESARNEAKAVEKSMKVVANCQKIAARVMAGDVVPYEDLQYLMEHDAEGYKLAMAMRKHKPDPEKHDRVSEDEEGESGPVSESSAATEGGTSGEAAPPTAEAPAVE